MSQWPAFQEPQPQQPPKRGGCLVYGCIGMIVATVVVVAALVGGGWWLVRFVDRQRLVREGPPPPLVEPTAEEFQEQVARGFREKETGLAGGELRSIERFFSDVQKSVGAADPEAASRLIDGDRFLEELDRSPNNPRLRLIDRTETAKTIAENNPFDLSGGFRLVRVERLKADGEFLVCGLFADSAGTYRPMRWWLIERRGTWKAYDWEETEWGRRRSEEIAVNFGLIYHAGAKWNEYDEALSALNGTPTYVGLPPAEALDLDKLEEQPFDERVRYVILIRLAHQRLSQREFRRCLRICDKVGRPEIRPIVYRLRAACLAELGRWEEALAAAQKYEELLCATPAVNDARARALVGLSRQAEAAGAWRKTLAVVPEDREAIRGLASVLPDDRKEELVRHVEKLPNARRQAREIVDMLAGWGDDASAQPLADWLAKSAPESFDALAAEGQMRDLADEPLEAARLYRLAMEKATSNGESGDLLYRFLNCMCRANKPQEAYEQAPDKRKVLEAFYYDYLDDNVYDLTTEQLRKIVDRHKAADPDDPQLPSIEAWLLEAEGRPDDAIATLKAAVGKNPETKGELHALLLRVGKWKEAYEMRPEPFDISSAILQLGYAKRPAEARALVELHEQQIPADPNLPLAKARLLSAEGRHAEAWAAVAPLLAGLGENSPMHWQLRALVTELVADGEGLIEAFAALRKEEDWWTQIASNLQNNDERAKIRELIAAWRGVHPESTLILNWEANLKHAEQDHAGVAALLGPALDGGKVSAGDETQLGTMLVKSLLELGNDAEARRHAQRLLEERQQYVPMLLIHVRAGEVEKVMEVVERAMQETDVSFPYLPYGNEGLDPLLTDERYAKLREAHPPQLFMRFAMDQAILLLQQPPQFSADELRKRLEPALAGVQVESLALEGPAECRWFLVTSGQNRALITAADKPYLSARARTELGPASQPLEQAIASHVGWIDIRSLDKERTLNLPILKALAPAAGDVLYVAGASALPAEALTPTIADAPYFGNANRLILVDDGLLARWPGPQDRDAWRELGEQCYLFRNVEEEELPPEVPVRAWRKFTKAFGERKGNEPYRVCVRMTQGQGSERIWFEVVRVEGQRYGVEVIGRAQTPSRLDLHLRPGEYRRIGQYYVVETDPKF